MVDIVVDAERCTGCGACVALCTGRVYRETNGLSEAFSPADCWLCGHCVAACPVDAIQHSEYPLEICPPVDRTVLPSLESLAMAFRERRSARVFRPQPVPRGVVCALADASSWVPSAGNGQPVDWLAVDDPARIASLSTQAVSFLVALGPAADYDYMLERQAQGRDPIFFRAPVVLVAHVPAGDYFGRDDAVYAAYNLMLAAERLGLGTCQIGYFQVALDFSADLRDALALPEDRKPEVTLVLGYPQYQFCRALPRRRPVVLLR